MVGDRRATKRNDIDFHFEILACRKYQRSAAAAAAVAVAGSTAAAARSMVAGSTVAGSRAPLVAEETKAKVKTRGIDITFHDKTLGYSRL